MGRVISVYGVIAGIIVVIGMAIGMTLVPDGGTAGMVAGYLSMLIAMSMVFVGTRQYRDTVKGGTVRFLPALGVALAIAGIACVFYVGAWEIFNAHTGGAYIDKYIADYLVTLRAEGKSTAEIAATAKEMAAFKAQYAQPLFRIAMTFSEIAPVGLLVSLASAALLRKSNFLPAKASV